MLGMQKRLSNNFYAVISLPSTAMGFALSVQMSALSWLLSTKFHLKIDEIGIVWAAGPLAGIFGQVIIGMVSDKVWFWGGRRRPFILIGGALAAMMLFLLPRIDVVSASLGISDIIVVAVMVAITLDLAINISFNPTRSIIADVTAEGAPRVRGYTWMQTISGVCSVAAYAIGALAGNDVLINVGVVAVLLMSVVPVFFIAEPRELRGEAAADRTATDWGQLWRIYLAHGFSWIGVFVMFVYVIAFIQQQLIPATASPAEMSAQSGQIINLCFMIMNIVGFLLPITVLVPLARVIGRVRTQAACVAVMAIGYFLIAYVARTPLVMYVLMAVVGIGWAAIVSLPFAIMSEKADKSRMGFFMGIFNLSVVLPQLFATLVLNKVVLAMVDKSAIFVICGACLTVSSLLWLRVKESAGADVAADTAVSGHPA